MITSCFILFSYAENHTYLNGSTKLVVQLSRHVDLRESDAIAKSETQNARVGLHTGADEEVFESLVFQASSQTNPLTLRVFLDFALPEEVFGELVFRGSKSAPNGN